MITISATEITFLENNLVCIVMKMFLRSFCVMSLVCVSIADDGTCTQLNGKAIYRNMKCKFDLRYIGFGRLLCQEITGYHPVGDSYASLMFRQMVYILDGSRSPNNSWCFYKSRYTIRRTTPEDLTMNIPISSNDVIFSNNNEGDTVINALLSEGFKSLEADYEPNILNNWGIVDSDPHCSNCDIHLRLKRGQFSVETLITSMQHAQKIVLRFNPVYKNMPKFFFSLLGNESILEELKVSGGENWMDLGVILPHLERLWRLDFSHTGLLSMELENFIAIPNLQELRLSRNAFEEIPEGISTLKNLTLLDLSWNPLKTTNLVQVLSHLRHLQWLFLANTSLVTLDPLMPLLAPSNDDSQFAILLGLDIGFCQLRSLDTNAARLLFKRQTQLKFLSLAGNNLGYLPPKIFSGLSELVVLNLSYTELSTGPGLVLSPGVTLKILDLSNNWLTSSEGILAQGSMLTLNLSGNSLRSWNDRDAFNGVHTLVLSNCSLTEFPESLLNSLSASSLKTVDLSFNLLDCTACSTPSLRQWLQKNADVVIPRPLTCWLPPSQMNQPVVSAQWDDAACRNNTIMIVGASVGAISVFFVLLTLFVYRFRFEVRYILHLVRVNRTATKTEDGDYQYDAFICYSGSDRLWVVRELLPRLEGGLEGYSLCLHERDFILGSFISHNIVNCIQSSRHTIVVLTNNFVKSQWCQWELEVASHRLLEGTRDFLILVELERLERRTMPRHLRLLMDTRTFLEWPSRDLVSERPWKRLKLAMGPSLKQASVSSCEETDA